MKSFKLPTDPLKLTEKSTIISATYDDTFHSTCGATRETQHVFIDGNNIQEKLENNKTLTIAELGFGFGVNFLTTLDYLTKNNSKLKNLNYVSIEGYPRTKEELKEFYQKTNLEESINNSLIQELLENYPKQIKGFHRLNLKTQNTNLTLIFHPVSEALKHSNLDADCWYLDGFSPAKNPEMWSEEIFKSIYQQTKVGGTFSTYTVSRLVKDNAQNAGFFINITPGFANKREMLTGKKHGTPNKAKSKLKVAIIGGGLAGASLAYSFGNRGDEVHLFEQNSELASRASGNQAAVIMPHLSSIPDHLCRYFLSGYQHSIRTLNSLHLTAPLKSFNQKGVLRLANVPKWQTIIKKLDSLGLNEIASAVSAAELKSKYNLNTTESALFFKDTGSINPNELTKRLIPESTQVHLNTKVKRTHSTSNTPQLELGSGEMIDFDYIIFANAYEAILNPETSWLPIEKIKGQLFTVKINKSDLPPFPICYDGYIAPIPESDELLIGATYEHNSHSEIFSEEVVDNLTNRLKNHFPDIATSKHVINKRVCFRTTSPDRLPLVGMIPDENQTPSRLYASLGHGSRGTISTLLAAEIIASQIKQEPLPIENDIIKELNPIRYLKRAHKREKTLQEIYPASYEWR